MRSVVSLALVVRLAVVASLLLAAPWARAQQQTGSLVLDVTDVDGKPIAGADITLESDRTATQLRTTDDHGRARFLLLPPGTYVVSVEAEGYAGTRREVEVPLGGVRNETFTIAKGELTESVEVTANPEVNVTETSTSDVYTSKEMQNVQIGSAGRSYLSVLGKAAGVVGGGGDPSVHGATIGENVYLIDGVNTTDPVTGTFGLLTNFDAIDQVELTTGGFQAEYGWATGGYVNQVTKSGTNEIHGTFDGRYYDERLIETTPHFGESDQQFRQLGFTLGGPIKKDKAWWFIALEDNLTEIAGADQPTERASYPPAATRKFTGQSYLAKLTFEPVPRQRISVQYAADPANIDNDNSSNLVAPEAGNTQKQGADFWKMTYWGGLTDKWAISAQAGWYSSVLNTLPLHDTGLPSVSDYFTGYLFQNYNDAQWTNRFNRQLTVGLERAWTGNHGDHDVKFGLDSQETRLESRRATPGHESWLSLGCDTDPNQDGIEDPACLAPDSDGDGIPDNVFVIQRTTDVGMTKNPGHDLSAYVQDTWRHDAMTFDYGLRWDAAKSERDDKQTVVDTSLIQPRLGMSFDLRHDGTQKLYWSLTRRMHPGILAVPSITNTHNGVTDVYYDERILGDQNGDGVANGVAYQYSLGGPSSSSVDKNLKATYLDEAILGYQRVLHQHHVFSARLVLNRTHDIIEDTLDDPALGTYVVTNLPGLKRRYEGIELEYHWSNRRGGLFANWTVARAQGNVEYDQGIGSDFDVLPVHSVNRYGYLSTDRRHRVKVYGWVDLPKQWTLAYDFFFGTGRPYQRVRQVTEYPGYGFEYLDPRGSHRLPASMTLDMDVKKHFTFGSDDSRVFTLIGTIHNVFGANNVTAVNELDGPDWGKATAYQAPRAYELGLRFEF